MDAKQRIQQIMDERGWSMYKLAHEAGLSQSTIANIFIRNTNPTIPTLEAICAGLGITLSQFFAEGDTVELTPEQREFFSRWLILTKEQKDTLLDLMRQFR